MAVSVGLIEEKRPRNESSRSNRIVNVRMKSCIWTGWYFWWTLHNYYQELQVNPKDDSKG